MNAKNNAYSIVSLVFFITYTIFQAPAVVLIRKFGPRRFLAAIVVMWGAVMLVYHSDPHVSIQLTSYPVIRLCA